MLQELLKQLQLEKLERYLYRGASRDIGTPRVFGGQVLAQALSAASQTVKNRSVHSLHAYFLRAGDIAHPIVYEVDPARDGLSFSMRRVTAIQHGRQIFNLSASFQKDEPGVEHQATMPEVLMPEELMTGAELVDYKGDKFPKQFREFYRRERPFDFRFDPNADWSSSSKEQSQSYFWFKTRESLPSNDNLHRILLAYVSDYNLIRTATIGHYCDIKKQKLQMASLDHAMWFHHSVEVDDWLLYATDSPSASGARGFARGKIYNRSGQLVASTAQEGLVRLITRPS